MGIMNMCWHENIILWDNSTVNREKKAEAEKKNPSELYQVLRVSKHNTWITQRKAVQV